MGGSSSTFDYDAQLANDKNLQTVEVGDELKGETRVRRCKKYPELVKYPYPEEKGGLKTVWEAFQRGVTKFGDNKLYGTRTWEFDEKAGKYAKDAEGSVKRGKYIWESYKDVDKVVRAFGSGLVELKAAAKDNIGIWSINRTEWMVASLATYSQNMRTVALYASLGEDAVEYIINHADIPIVITEKENVKKLIHLLPKMKTVRTIIQMDPNPLYGNQGDKLEDADIKSCAEAKVQLIGFQEVVKLGAEKHFPVEPTESDLAFIMYTSGTTGQPKGAMLGHGNLMANMATTPLIVPLKGVDDVHISYLPLAHIFETIVQVGIIMQGGSIGYFQGNVKKLFTDFADLEPTIVCGVPRIYGRIFQRVMTGVAEKNCMARYFFHKFYNTQAANIRAGKPRDAKADQKVFIPLRAKLGMGKTRVVLTGAAPCPPYLMEFLKILTGGMVLQGYGLTETCAGTNSSLPDDPNVGHVGPPLPCIEEKLRDVPEMGYLSTDKPCPRGEVIVRGASVFQGYFKNEKATAECLDKDGWFSTGDIGRWNPNGTLSIIDRKKNLFKLSQGEYIASEKIESVYAKSATVGQVWVYGNSYKSFVLAVVVPAAEYVAKHAVKSGWWPSTEPIAPGTDKFSADFAKCWEGPHKKELQEYVLQGMRASEGKELKGFEVVKDIIIEYKIDAMMAGFTEANECLTPSFKLRRPYLLRRYKDALKDLYAKCGEPNAADEKWPGEP